MPLAPDDEFDLESKMIADILGENSGEEEIAQTVSQVFSKMFEPELFGVEHCIDVARAIRVNIEEISTRC